MQPIAVDGVSAGYGAKPVIAGIDLTVPAGALCCLLGPSGCGKTTLLRTIAGFIAPSAGRIRIGERDVTDLPPERRSLGMVFQHYCLWPHRDVSGNVAFPLEQARVAAGERAGRVAAALAGVALPGSQARRVGELSGGQQQRVAIARALVGRPQVLLLDEPLSNLDARLRHELRDEIRRLCREHGVTAVCVTHDQSEALAMADLLAVMVDGRLAQVGSPRTCYDRPATRTVAAFLGEANLITGRRRDEGLDLGPLGTVPAGPGAASAATWCLRPERLRIDRAPPGARCWPARVVDAVFEGPSTRLELDVGGTRLLARVAGTAPAAGDAVVAWCQDADAVILPEA